MVRYPAPKLAVDGQGLVGDQGAVGGQGGGDELALGKRDKELRIADANDRKKRNERPGLVSCFQLRRGRRGPRGDRQQGAAWPKGDAIEAELPHLFILLKKREQNRKEKGRTYGTASSDTMH
ncbi:hypothetical protein MAPG_05939 [Magnaporthiopsis poae ATCC 64411]|uniref:Uncharacterized protein n=1 Tax=Magnaporthiopsis poae (strain ATCC 64411 / 73-15) TaxID=644358 RepID=A0A0C4E0Q7_MAGP6|nr:hypothetical protein MAPG_05939 [Magnaporthiopsis poae ATCC 64411]